MPTHADKNQENKSKAVANAASQKKSDSKSAFQFKDNQPEAIQMRKFQEMANNYTQKNSLQFVDNQSEVTQMKRLQGLTNNSPQTQQLVQLQKIENEYSKKKKQQLLSEKIINSTLNESNGIHQFKLISSIGRKYAIDDSKTDKLLVSKKTEEKPDAPMPIGLYEIKNKNKDWDEYSPNVALIPAEIRGKTAERNYDYINKKVKDVSNIKTALKIIGPNDCARWATTLQESIEEDMQLPNIPRETEKDVGYKWWAASSEEEGGLETDTPLREPEVGTKLLHKAKLTETCDYHSATIVAKDLNSLVTLEAHAGKQELTKPEFHIRGPKIEGAELNLPEIGDNSPGINDFMRSNIEVAKQWWKNNKDKDLTDEDIHKYLELYHTSGMKKDYVRMYEGTPNNPKDIFESYESLDSVPEGMSPLVVEAFGIKKEEVKKKKKWKLF